MANHQLLVFPATGEHPQQSQHQKCGQGRGDPADKQVSQSALRSEGYSHDTVHDYGCGYTGTGRLDLHVTSVSIQPMNPPAAGFGRR